MYQPTLGRFLSRDPLPDSGPQILHPFPDMGPPDANLYRYVGNNPATNIDPSGRSTLVAECGPAEKKVCKLALHAWHVYDFDRFPNHFGITMIYTDPNGKETKVWLDGFGQVIRKPIEIRRRTDQPKHPTYVEAKPMDKDPDCCKKIEEYIEKFNKARIPYNPTECNSNYAVRCMLQACGAKFEPPPGTRKPIGYDCSIPINIPPFFVPRPCPGFEKQGG